MTPEQEVTARIACMQVAAGYVRPDPYNKEPAVDVVRIASVLYNFVASGEKPSPPGRKAKDKSASVDPMS